MIDIALATKNRISYFKNCLINLNSMINSSEFCLFIMDGNLDSQVSDFINSRSWNFHLIKIWKDLEVQEVAKNPGQWAVIYNFLLKQGNSPYLTYWSDDLFLKEINSFSKAISRIESTGPDVAASLLAISCINMSKKPFFMIAETGAVIINFGVIKRQLFEKVGYFDEKFKFFCADRDLSNKLYVFGYKIILNLDLVVTHANMNFEWRSSLVSQENILKDRFSVVKKWIRLGQSPEILRFDFLNGIYYKSFFYLKNLNFF